MNKNTSIGTASGAGAGFGIAKLCKAGNKALIITTLAVAVAGGFVAYKMKK